MIGKQQTIPANWVMAPLCEAAEINPRLDKSTFAEDVEVSFVPMPAVEAETGKIDASQIRTFGEVKKGYTPFEKGDVLFAKITPCMENGKMAVVPKLHNSIGFGSTEFHVLRHGQGIDSSFLYYFVSSKVFRSDAEHNMTGAVGQKRVPTIYLESCNIPLPPSNEQKRIVSKLEELLSKLDKGIESFKTARKQLTVYRQAVLKHAFEGKLTEEWRKKHADELGPAETLLEKIKTEREQRYRQQLDDWKRAVKAWEVRGKEGKNPTKPGKPKELPPLTETELSELPELPDGWRWVKLSNVTDVSGGITKNAKREKLELQVSYLRVANVYRNDLRLDDIHKIGVEPNELERTLLEYNDLLIVEGNGSKEQIGRAALWNGKIKGCVHQNHLIKARPYLQLNPNFALYFLLSNAGRDLITEVASSTSGLYTLNISKVEGLRIPFLAIREQDKIVEEIASRLSPVEKLEQDIEGALKQAKALRQSLLKKAFEGRLVPQDSNDEPASVLLERIKTEKAKLKKQARKQKRVPV